jgi:inactivated superfamily I helicase
MALGLSHNPPGDPVSLFRLPKHPHSEPGDSRRSVSGADDSANRLEILAPGGDPEPLSADPEG